MAIFVVVRTLDVDYATVDAGITAFAAFDDASGNPMTRVQAGAFELKIPDGTKKVSILVNHAAFFLVQQDLTLNATAGGTPSLAFAGDQNIGVRSLDNHSRDGGSHNVEVTVVMSQMRDVTDVVDSICDEQTTAGNVVTLALRSLRIMQFEDKILERAGGTGTFHHTSITIQAEGRLFALERMTAPKLVAVYVPQKTVAAFQKGNVSMKLVPIPYHVFYHPFTGSFAGDYPFSFRYLDLVARYVTYDQISTIGKAMANQHDAAGNPVVFVMPIGGAVGGFGTGDTQAGLLQMLKEINYSVQRLLGVPLPLQEVGKVAISGFSFGIRSVARVLGGTRIDQFHDVLLREVYSFDGVFSKAGGKKGEIDLKLTGDCINNMKSWLRGGADNRTIRVYTQNPVWMQGLAGSIVNPTSVKGSRGSSELFGDNGTILLAPLATWIKADPDILATMDMRDPVKSVHQIIPALFMQHAIKMSRLRNK